MKFDIPGKPVRAILKIHLNPGEGVILSPESRVVMEGVLVEQMTLDSLNLYRFVAARPDAFLWISHMRHGDIQPVQARGESFLLNRGAYVGHFGSFNLKSSSEEFFIRLEGLGIIWLGDESILEEIVLSQKDEIILEMPNILMIDEKAYMRLEPLVPPSGYTSIVQGKLVRVRGPARLVIRHGKRSTLDIALSMLKGLDGI